MINYHRPAYALFAVLLIGAQPFPSPAASLGYEEQAPPAQLERSPEALLKAMEPPAQDQYTVDSGDELTVEVLDHPELSGHHIIGPDGEISVPLHGPLRLSGRTRDEAAEAISAALSKFYKHPIVIVRIDKYASNRIFLLGKIAMPGVMYFDRVPTLLEAISRGGVLAGDPKTWPSRIGIFRGTEQEIWLDLKAMLDAGSSIMQVRLMRGDVIYIPGNQENFVTVLGEVMHPGVQTLDRNLAVSDALALSGGLSEKASADHIQLIRKVNGQTRDLTLADVLHGRDGAEALLKPGDVIYVPRSGMAKVASFMQILTPLGMMLTFAAATAH